MMIENMSKKTKVVLSFVGVSAVVVPVLLLIFTASNTRAVPEVSQENRPVDTKSLEDTARRTLPSGIPMPTPSPVPSPTEGSPGAQ